MPISARRLAWEAMSFMAHGVGSLRRTDSVAIEGIADIRRSLAARRSDANDPLLPFGNRFCCDAQQRSRATVWYNRA